jgi:acyl-CoA synthetase (NDP forming)
MNLDALLNPKSVALLGVSRDPSRIGGRILRYLKQHGYGGTILPVNPKYEEIGGEKCYPSLASIPLEIDKDKGTLMKISTLQDEGIVIKRSYATTSKTGCAGSSSSHHGPWD